MVLEDITEKKVPAIDIFAHSIKALANHLMEALESRGTGVISNDIQWVLTVPAIWTDNAKQFMRKSAEKVFYASIKLFAVDYIYKYMFTFLLIYIIFIKVSTKKGYGMIAIEATFNKS